jgi:hypothetical protein
MLTVDLLQDFPQPLSQVFQDFHDHEKLGRILRAPMKHIRDGSGEGGRHGVGSMRRVGPPGPLAFEETVVSYETDKLIEYKVTRGSPIKNHLGRMVFSERPGGGGCRLHYTITFEAKLAPLGPVIRWALARSIEAALQRYAARR